jgi:hypothetical protein
VEEEEVVNEEPIEKRKKAVEKVVEQARSRFRRAQVSWSGVHFATAYGAAFVSAITAVLAGRSAEPAVTASFAVAAAVLAAAQKVGRFEDKWRSARLSRGKIDGLKNELDMSKPDLDQILKSLTKIIEAHDRVVVQPSEPEAAHG